jgi:hypothetical protein
MSPEAKLLYGHQEAVIALLEQPRALLALIWILSPILDLPDELKGIHRGTYYEAFVRAVPTSYHRYSSKGFVLPLLQLAFEHGFIEDVLLCHSMLRSHGYDNYCLPTAP